MATNSGELTDDHLSVGGVHRRIVEAYKADHIAVFGRGLMFPIEPNWRERSSACSNGSRSHSVGFC
jgi:hypothetical protein